MTDDTTTDDGRTDELIEIIEKQNERINQLEDVVQQQAQAIWPSRRQALKATGAAAIFGAGAISNAAAAPGDDGDTVWGSDSNRDDYYMDELDANLVSTGDLDIDGANFVSSGDVFELTDATVGSDINQTTTSTSYTTVEYWTGPAMPHVPSDATLVGRFRLMLKNDTADETTFARPAAIDGNGSVTELNELEISVTDTSFATGDSGWTEITTTINRPYKFEFLQGRVSAGTGEFRFNNRHELKFGIQL